MESKFHFKALDAWRGIAALAVAAFHLRADGYLSGLTVVRHAYLLVDFFFVLSGFVIAFNYAQKLNGVLDAARFMIKRMARIWPLNLALLCFLCLVQLLKLIHAGAAQSGAFAPPHGLDTLATNVLLVQALGPWGDGGWNPPAWSVSVEFYTYVVFALALMLAGRRWPGAALLILCGALALRIAFPGGGEDRLLSCLAGFFAGALTAQAWRRWPLSQAQASFFQPVAAAAVLLVLIAGGRLAALAAPLVFSGAVFAFSRDDAPLSRALCARPFQALGLWSYSIYMIHWTLLTFMEKGLSALGRLIHYPLIYRTAAFGERPEWWAVHLPPLALDGIAALFLAAVVAVSWQTYERIERPARDAIARFAPRPGAARLQQAA